ALEALLNRKRGNDNAAQRSLRRALQLAEGQGVFRLFLDEGKDMIQLLHEAYTALAAGGPETHPDDSPERLRNYVSGLLEAAGEQAVQAPGPVGDSSFQPLEALTEREREILVYLGNGVSNKDM